MKNTNHLPALLLLCFLLLNSKVYAVQDIIKPVTAKTAWDITLTRLKPDYKSLLLFKAYPQERIDSSDTLLCQDVKTQDGHYYKNWNGKAYTWVFECRVPKSSNDSILFIHTYLDIHYNVTISVTRGYKPIAEYADTIEIAEGTWFDSDSLSKIPFVVIYGFWSKVSLERGVQFFDDSVAITMWKMEVIDEFSGDAERYLSIDAFTGKTLKFGVVSVSEQDDTEKNRVFITPNPTRTSISLSTDNEVGWVNLYSMMGEKVFEWSTVLPHQKLSVAHLPEGMYMVQYHDNNNIHSILIIISR